jgi:ABC-type transporter Mla maintaining outer membrane lipid asymmetry permease subunit MlaE
MAAVVSFCIGYILALQSAAEVGTMSVTEEIDALRVMGLDPVEFTLAPKLLAALIADMEIELGSGTAPRALR